jgi:L-fucose isomerase-like protein
MPKIGFITCVHPIYNLPSVVGLRDSAVSALRNEGCHVIVPETARQSGDVPDIVSLLKAGDIDLLVFFFCTWVAEDITLGLARQLMDVPLLLWALPYFEQAVPMPSPMTGLTATGCNIRRLGKSYVHRVGSITPEHVRAVARTAEIAAIVTGLRRARFGIFGSTCPGMIDSGCDEALLHRCLGVTTLRRDVDDLLRARDDSSGEEARRLASELVSRVGASDVAFDTIAEQYRLYLGAKSLVEAGGMDGFSARCWPELRDRYKSPICLTMAELSESGVPTACEADLTALVTTYVLTKLTGQPSYSLEVTAYLEQENALQLAHCGSAAISLAADPRRAVVRSHLRAGTGALVEFGLKPGTVTIAKILRPFDDSIRMFVGRGEVIPTPGEVRGSVATIRVEPSMDEFLDAMLQNAVEHHLVIAYGDWTEDLAQFAKLAGIEWIDAGSGQARSAMPRRAPSMDSRRI